MLQKRLHSACLEVAGPEAIPLDKLGREVLAAIEDRRRVIADVHARYYGTESNDRTLARGSKPRVGPARFDDGLRSSRQG
jgi:hypothetical protein